MTTPLHPIAVYIRLLLYCSRNHPMSIFLWTWSLSTSWWRARLCVIAHRVYNSHKAIYTSGKLVLLAETANRIGLYEHICNNTIGDFKEKYTQLGTLLVSCITYHCLGKKQSWFKFHGVNTLEFLGWTIRLPFCLFGKSVLACLNYYMNKYFTAGSCFLHNNFTSFRRCCASCHMLDSSSMMQNLALKRE